MITVAERETIRRAYFVEGKSIRQIARELHHSRRTVEKALESAEPASYTLTAGRPAPVLGPYQAQIDALLAENERLPRKQRYTSHKIYEALQAAGYGGSESNVRRYIAARLRGRRAPKVFLPLEFDPGADAQVDWGEAEAIIDERQETVQLFVMRLCYSRRIFTMAFPTQRQEAFFEAHVCAFHHFEGVPQRLTYDNLTTAVRRILEGRTRVEQQAFIVFRSHYLFESHFCTPGEGHEKGGVEHGVGFARRNFMVPLPRASSYAALNEQLLAACRRDDQRRVHGQELTIGEAWELERAGLRALPARDLPCCATVPVTLTPYSQVIYETNRYSVPADQATRQLILRAYPFRIEILNQEKLLASHVRCYGREQDIFDPLHYLPLLEQRPGAFEHAKPLRRWRDSWPAVYEQLLARLRDRWPDGRGVREFVQILKLHAEHPADLVELAVTAALEYGCAHRDGVRLCLHHLLEAKQPVAVLDLSHQPHLASVASEAPDLRSYEQLLSRRST